MPEETMTYRSAGVGIDEAHRALRAVTSGIQSTYGEAVVAGVGGFGGLFRASFPDYQNPVLVSSIDGVGTKTRVAAMAGDFSGLGRDIVNHCVNDILCQGARPLFFMDYYGTSRLQGTVFESVLADMSEACKAAGAALIGGETAEMPDIYHDDEIDLVGSIVGIVEFDEKLPRGKVQPGDSIVGLASDGLHTNGFSLARRALFEMGGLSMRDKTPNGETIGEVLLRPHRSYLKSVYPLLSEFRGIYAAAHITGGGFYENLPRVMPSDTRAVVDRRSWNRPPIFEMIQASGNVPDTEMYSVFNMGVGMALFVDRSVAPTVVSRLIEAGESATVIGEVQEGTHDVQIV